ncbi:MAG: carboxypeptidase-like regulatory domain-containing protein [Ekhidna sp.]|nr:carboxypeptidase-like regulatory domain-containing protein [Ekhidna sp.]
MAQFVIEGHVVDSNTAPIPFTSVYDKVNKNGSYTNVNGYFKLELEALPITLVFSNVGYNTKEILISEPKRVTVILEERILELNEVTIQGRKLTSKHLGSPNKEKRCGISTCV